MGCRRSLRCRTYKVVLAIGCIFIVALVILMSTDKYESSSNLKGPFERHDDKQNHEQKHEKLPPRRQQESIKLSVSPPEFRQGILGNYESRVPPPFRTGLGESGVPVKWAEEKRNEYSQSIKEYGFNVALSDQISLDRAAPDIRDKQCKYWHYPEKLPNASVVIAFSNEGFSTLLRTVHSVMNTSPPDLLAEVIMVDDMSDKAHLGKRLEDYIKQERFLGKVKIVRNTKREGLARTRTNGAMVARGEVVVFLDAHCECSVNWLVPLLAEIAHDRTTVVCPTVDAITAEDLSYHPQGDLSRGAFDWGFWYKRIAVTWGNTMDRIGMKYKSQAYDSPAMAGGLFAMDRSYFIELGGYDPGLFIWGGEQFEISFKIWMCGGRLKFVPCSRVGHIYRHGIPYKYPSIDGDVSIVDRNYMRVAEVWMDEYKEHFYTFKPRLRGKSCGDISKQVEFRKKNCPRSFRWFMENVAFDSLELFPTPPPNRFWGEFRLTGTSLCLDSMGQKLPNLRIGVSGCHGFGGNQEFRLSTTGRIQYDEYCLMPSASNTYVKMSRCRESHRLVGDVDYWSFSEESGLIRLKKTNLCIDVDTSKTNDVILKECDPNSKRQKFTANKVA
ncbi:probable N-acetylgalactosaminyltransferase 7 [Asterias amurensis]|uniref:probable N-acetylgalactosaminyltransferase 7 n=1 Tax=Asterias amurensis TaxID=7602 RepID=UPI003AB1A1C2